MRISPGFFRSSNLQNSLQLLEPRQDFFNSSFDGEFVERIKLLKYKNCSEKDDYDVHKSNFQYHLEVVLYL